MIHNKFQTAKEENKLLKGEENMPLVILHPNKFGKSALDIAIRKQRVKSFELMVNLLEPFENFTISKMMLNCFSSMLSLDSEMIIRFFGSAFFRPALMENPLVVQVPDDIQEQNFAHHTCLITEKTLSKLFLGDQAPQDTGTSEPEEVVDPSVLRPYVLPLEGLEEESSMKRVSLKAIDFDWIFKGQNAEMFLKLLTTTGSGKLLIQPPIKIFVQMLWDLYRPRIIANHFIPYLCQMVLFLVLIGKAGDHLDQIKQEESAQSAYVKFIVGLTSFVLTVFQVKLISSEYRQVKVKGAGYLADYWNWIDFLSIVLSLSYLAMLNINIIRHEATINVVLLRTIGAVVSFFLWMKNMYWMRLNNNTAHFVTLIQRTIADSKTFTMVLILSLAAFANFFYVINYNSGASYSYVSSYVGVDLVDAMISMYLLSLGEFSSLDDYTQGPNSKIAYAFFCLATWLVLIVFMNMLIAIMSATFADVQVTWEENSLVEQAKLIVDYIKLVDLEKEFKGKRYIICAMPDVSLQQQQSDLQIDLRNLKVAISKRTDMMNQVFVREIDALERSTRQVLKQ